MKLEIDNKEYDVIITYKNNKNMYLRIKDDLKIYITAPKYISNKEITNFIKSNIKAITKILQEKENLKQQHDNKFLYLGKSYDIVKIYNNKIIIGNDKVFLGDINIDTFYKKQAKILFKERLDYCYNNFSKTIPYPELKIRKMTSKWGVCNITKKIVTLNLNLIKIDIKYLDYVIIHELSHLIHANHSKNFWALVEENCPNYKQIKKEMKNIL